MNTIDEKINKVGLDPESIQRDLERVQKSLSSHIEPIFKIQDTCRVDNGGICQLPTELPLPQGKKFAHFTLAAGAASRYFAPIAPVLVALKNKNTSEAVSSSRLLRQKYDFTKIPLHKGLMKLMKGETFGDVELETCWQEITLPKALQPGVSDGATFLDIKEREIDSLPGQENRIYVVSPAFEKEIQQQIGGRSRTIIQGPNLSTIRFSTDGQPIQIDDHLCPVPAGHGALTNLFPQAKQTFPHAESILIRNIDNVMGNHPEAVNAASNFMAFHGHLLGQIKKIRKALSKNEIDNASHAAHQLLEWTNYQSTSAHTDYPAELDALWQVQADIFHTPKPDSTNLDTLITLFNRPVNCLGQVPNTTHDVGGTPAFVEHAGKTIKVCIELPHVNSSDRQEFLENPVKATHFNPVFVCAELTEDPGYYADRNFDFWILAKKSYHGEQVLYVETVLFELLGNSELANTVMVEIPRCIFNPHKSILDGENRQWSDWFV